MILEANNLKPDKHMTTNKKEIIDTAIGTIIMLNFIAKQTYSKSLFDLRETELSNIKPVLEKLMQEADVE